jgi:hypothetical protein
MSMLSRECGRTTSRLALIRGSERGHKGAATRPRPEAGVIEGRHYGPGAGQRGALSLRARRSRKWRCVGGVAAQELAQSSGRSILGPASGRTRRIFRVSRSQGGLVGTWRFPQPACHQDPVKVVKLRFFSGLSVEETAAVLGISLSTANRRWNFARAWLFATISGSGVRAEKWFFGIRDLFCTEKSHCVMGGYCGRRYERQ